MARFQECLIWVCYAGLGGGLRVHEQPVYLHKGVRKLKVRLHICTPERLSVCGLVFAQVFIQVVIYIAKFLGALSVFRLGQNRSGPLLIHQ